MDDQDIAFDYQASTIRRGVPSPDSREAAQDTGPLDKDKFFSKFVNDEGRVDMGHLLPNMAAHYVSTARNSSDTIGDPTSLPAEMTICSLCSGSGCGELTFSAGAEAVSNEYMIPLGVDVSFMCEKEKWKQRFILENLIKADSSTCLYDDVVKLGNLSKDEQPEEPAHMCVRHKGPCDPRKKNIFLLKSGFSCKGNSRSNMKFAEYRMSMKNKDFNNSSVATFYGTCGVIHCVQPQVFVLENVDSIGDEHTPDTNLQQVMQTLGQIREGMYSVKVFHTLSSDFFVPQSRTRVVKFMCWILSSHLVGSESYSDSY